MLARGVSAFGIQATHPGEATGEATTLAQTRPAEYTEFQIGVGCRTGLNEGRPDSVSCGGPVMDWLIHNVIADMYGPSFLLVYSVIALVIITVAYWMVRARDETGLREPPPVPSILNPYEIAYLRGGENEVIRTVLYVLYQLGFIQGWLKARPLVERADGHDTKDLTELEERVLRSIHQPVEVSDLFQSAPLGSDVEELCGHFRHNLESDHLLRPDHVRHAALRIPLLAASILIALSLYKILIAVNRGLPNIGFLIILTFLSLILLWKVVGRAATARISDR